MSWIKRNLSLVISGVIAIGLLGLGGWYLYNAIEKNKSVDDEINNTKSEIERSLNAQVTPNDANLKLVRQEAAKVATFVADARKQFPSPSTPAVALNNQSFKELLQTTVDRLHKEANSIGIKLETNYYFTFEAQRLPVMFPPETLRPLTDQLSEVERLASILFKARINRLEGMRRASVPGELVLPAGGGAANAAGDYLNTQGRANPETGMVLWPYEVSFDCFTAEFGSVVEALGRVENGFIVKSIVSEPVSTARGLVPTNRPAGLVTVINERLLRVTLRLEVIKPVR